MHFKFILFILLLKISDISALHVKGTWNSKHFFLFLAKFGFQRTDKNNIEKSQGYIYGNITSNNDDEAAILSLVVVDSEFFMEYYGNRTATSKPCPQMFEKIHTIAFDAICQPTGPEDFLRKVPCLKNKLCIDEDNANNVVSSFQFTYKVQDMQYPRFWYISIVACHRNATDHNCSWIDNHKETLELTYDIWIVNGNPDAKHLNPFEYQFSFEFHDVFEIHLVFLVFYIILLPTWLYAYSKQKHPLTKLLTACICQECIGISFNFLHTVIFSINGSGVFWLQIVGNAIDTISQCLFMLVLLLIAKGWTITNMELSRRYVLFAVWGAYTLFNVVLFIWNLTEIDVISNIDEWETWPGYLTLGFRLIIMVWFILELRQTFRKSKHPSRLLFFQQFGAYFLVWFVYLPILALISTQISALWKYKTILSITYAADLLSFAVFIHLLWPSRSVLYLIKEEESLRPYELEITGLLDDDDEDTVFSKSEYELKMSNDENMKANNHISIQPSKRVKRVKKVVTANGATKPLASHQELEEEITLL